MNEQEQNNTVTLKQSKIYHPPQPPLPLTITERDLSSISYTSTTKHYHPSTYNASKGNKTVKNFSATTSSFSNGSFFSGGGGSGNGTGFGTNYVVSFSPSSSRMNQHVCNNCGKVGHLCYQCKLPIISYGIILFRQRKTKTLEQQCPEYEYLMICRRNTFGYIDFVRGKYSVYNIPYLCRLFSEMTVHEKQNILTMSYDSIWVDMWETPLPKKNSNLSSNTSVGISKPDASATATTTASTNYRTEESNAKHKFEQLRAGVIDENGMLVTLETLCQQGEKWEDPEWEFPKGRRNYSEKELSCALREFQEETGYSAAKISVVENLMPFEEQFIGSNWKAYKHKYFLACCCEDGDNGDSDDCKMSTGGCVTKSSDGVQQQQQQYQTSEVSKMEWKTYEECMRSIRSYHLEKRTLITCVHKLCTGGMFHSVV